MTTAFPYVTVPEELEAVFGDFDEETRSYHAHGEESQRGYWYDVLTSYFGGVIPPSEVGMFVPVSRPAIHNRINSGRLTTFHFHSTPATKGLFFNKKEARDSAYVYVPIRECKAWAGVVKDKMKRLGHATVESIEAEKPEWFYNVQQFLDPDGFRSEFEQEEQEQAVRNELERKEYEAEKRREAYEQI
ncbi:hypothetical protein JO972_12325 [Verrucomicrobiaceae bacterium 5K15]|uniref:Uncharacterized protein n=1 Tax=Oceaniferula flava TaxID=2800421 RepID=A0AAE2VCK2_9BACT|nr:hypothetical protein [Oceaniferula flavus]MBK1855750.1 hypothetical protein [Oceaniferula flavus]MBM1137057.1 hypothetical protein [Oceaniferula flavus]